MSIFSASIQHRSYHWQINTLCFVLGILIAAAWQTSTAVSRMGNASQRAGFYYGPVAVAQVQEEKQKLADLQAEIKKRGDDVTTLQNTVAQRTDASETLNKQLQEMKLQAGLTNAVGPGVEITLSDSRNKPTNVNDITVQANLIHDTDVMTFVNELRASGAEAISVNDQRVVGTTPIRCVGPNILVNGLPYASPFVIRAIGDPNAMYGGLKTPGGVVDKTSLFDPSMVKIEKKTELKLPAFAGNTQIRYAKSEASPDAAPTKTESKPDTKANDKKESQSP